MSLLTPLFLFGLLGIGIPYWLHRLQTQTTEREKFSSAMFLEPSKKRIHVQRKLKYLLLMALRMMFLALLALAFTRPSFLLPPKPLVSEDSTHHVVVIDASFSMHEGDSFEQALARANTIINNLEDGDLASIYTASTTVKTISTPSSDLSSLTEALSGLNPDYGRLDIGAMVSSLNGLIEASRANFQLHIISDFQQSGQAVRFADMIPDVINGRPVTLLLEQVKTNDTANLSVSSIVVVERDKVSVELRGYVDAAITKTVSLAINDVVQQELNFQAGTTPDGNTVVLFDDITFADGDNKIAVQISPVDSLPEDDLRHAVFDNSPPAPVLLLTANPTSLANTYISAALETAPRGYEVQVTALANLDSRILQRYPWIVIEDLGALEAALADELADYIRGGGSVLAALGESSQNIGQIPISGHSLTGGVNLSQRTNHTITQIDTGHPALDRALGWNNVNVSNALPLDITEEDKVLISLDNNVPLLLERNMGLGRLLLFTTSLNNNWTDLPVKPVFVTFMAEAAQYLSNENLLIKEQVIGSYLQLTQNGGASGQIFDPDGESLLSLEDTTQAQDIQLNKTGYYQVFTPQGEVLVAVNADSRESDLSITETQALQRWQNSVAGSAGSTPTLNSDTPIIETDPDEMEIWRVLLVLLAIIVLVESLLSNRYLRFNTGQ